MPHTVGKKEARQSKDKNPKHLVFTIFVTSTLTIVLSDLLNANHGDFEAFYSVVEKKPNFKQIFHTKKSSDLLSLSFHYPLY